MSRLKAKKRSSMIKRKQLRKGKLRKLKEAFLAAHGKDEKEKIMKKMVVVSPFINVNNYLDIQNG